MCDRKFLIFTQPGHTTINKMDNTIRSIVFSFLKKNTNLIQLNSVNKMVFAGSTAGVKRSKLGNVAIDSEGRTMSEYRKDEKKGSAAHQHSMKYGFLSSIKDSNGRKQGDEGYDCRKLYVPQNSLSLMTPFERQYWEIKMQNWDTVLFFKKGKFYELYERDADIGHQQFDLKLIDTARSSMRMVGIPEQGFNGWAARFIGAGHKIGRVEQLQTRTQLDRSGGSKTAIVPRELCQVLTLGTITELDMFMDHNPNYLVTIKESNNAYGVVVTDTSRGMFRFAFLPEDEQRSALVTLLHSTKPKEIILERGCVSKLTLTIIEKELGSVRKTFLTSKNEFLSLEDAHKHFQGKNYFPTDPDSLPQALQEFWSDPLVMSAFGALAVYLVDSKQDTELFSIKNFGKYDPSMGGRAVTLDGTALSNLEVLESANSNLSPHQRAQGTLLGFLNHCVWSVGRRRLHNWVCSPLRNVLDITNRQDAVAELVECPDKLSHIQRLLRPIPDLERCLNRLGMAGREREVAWVDPIAYNKKIVNIFLSTLSALKQATEFVSEFKERASADLLKSAVTFKPEGGKFPDIGEKLAKFETCFDVAKAESSGQVVPRPGTHAQYDKACSDFSQLEGELDDHLQEIQMYYKNNTIRYNSIGKDHYLVEIPAALGNKKPFPGFEKKSETKAIIRYRDLNNSKLIMKVDDKKEDVDVIKRRVLKDILLDFSEGVSEWRQVIECLATLDCLCSLAVTSSANNMTRPVVKERKDGEAPYLRARNVIHPLMKPGAVSKSDTMIANDITIGGDEPPVILITGPNMGGKSTIMRCACVVIILAQLGCFVPASFAELTPVDRIFTRIGACDRILSGLSTFMVEMRETSSILHHATQDSFVVLDELGRGTATVDGYSIAHSVLLYIAETYVFIWFKQPRRRVML